MINTEELIDKNIVYYSKYSNKDKEFAKVLIDYRYEINEILTDILKQCTEYIDKHYINKGLVECGQVGKKLSEKNDI